MNWFVAKVIFQIEGGESAHPQFDEQLRLVDAINEELALEMAHQLAYIYQDEVKSDKQQTVKWKFIGVTELAHLGNLEHGKEIHYHIVEPDDMESYLALADEKANSLRNRKTA
jgi:hypothetical protein